jgi:4-amino-4-deoxy-L-arabinose transferase-like glycosyltransferase
LPPNAQTDRDSPGDPPRAGIRSRLDDWLANVSSGAGGGWGEVKVALLVALAGVLLYVPLAGTYGLWDPWETHYGEVARQMTRRGDFISLWWPGSPRDQEVFWSKPVLSFWLMSIAMHVAGIGKAGGDPGEMALGTRAEWALRTPFCLMGVLGIVAVYLVTARFVSRRAGLLAAAALATAPMYSLVARQAMTDMAFVGPMTMALALGAMALFDDRDEALPRRGWGPSGSAGRSRPLGSRLLAGLLSWPHHGLFYLAVALLVLTVAPQLVVNSIQLRVEIPWGDRVYRMYGVVAMIPYFVALLATLVLMARARYKAPLYLHIAAVMCGLSVLAKGLAGLGLPLIVFLAYLTITGSWRRLRRAQLLLGTITALAVCTLVAAPWHHAMIIRHGWAFWNELFGDNHWRRMVLGRHGDRGAFDYFLRELGYAVWPWLTVAPAALAWAVMRRVRRADPAATARAQGIVWLGAIWFVCTYAVVSLSVTKFHHYVLPAIPGLAICIGCFLDYLLAARPGRRTAAAVALAGLPLLLLTTYDLAWTNSASQRFLWLFSYDYIHNARGRPWPEALAYQLPLALFAALFALATALLGSVRLRRWATLGLATAAVAFTFFLLDGYMRQVAPFWSQKQVIASYYRARTSPDEPLIAYLMYWRGETFYTKNAIYEGPQSERTVFDADGADDKLRDYLGRHRGRRLFFLFERGQQSHLTGLLPPEARASFRIVDSSNNKFALGEAQL